MSLADLKNRLNNRKAEQAAKKAQYIKPVRFQAGKNRIRVLPGWNPAQPDVFYHDFGMHYVKDKESKLAAVYVCTDKTYSKECPVCSAIYEGIRQAKDTGNLGMEKLLGQAKATGRVLVNALMRDSAEPNKPVVVELPSGVFDSMVDQMMVYLDEGEEIINPATGYDFIVTKTGSGIDTEYSVAVSPKSTAVEYDKSAVTDLAAYCSQESEQGLLKAVRATTAVTGLPAPATALLSAPAAAATGTEGPAGFFTPPAGTAASAPAATATVVTTAPAAAVGGAALLNTAAAAADQAEADLEALEGELMEDAPWESDETPVVETPKAAPVADLAAEIDASADDLDDILNGLDDL